MKSAVQTGRATGQAPQGDTQGKKHSEFLDTSKVNIILVPSTHICQEVSTWPREAVSYVLVGGEAISHHTNLPEQGTPSSRSRRWL